MMHALIFLLSAACGLVHAAGTITCTGIEDSPAVQAALNAGGITTLQGVCVSANTITITQPGGMGNQNGETVLQGGVLRIPSLVIDGVRRAEIRGTEFYTTGTGITIRNAIMVGMHGIYVASGGHCLAFESIAGVWMTGKSHCNALPAAVNSTGVMIGSSAQGFEAVDISGLLVEGYYSCVRIGGTGNNVNMWFRGLKCDRPGTFGIIVNPSSTAGARNIEFVDTWINCAPYPFAINVAETTGRADRIHFNIATVLGAQYALPTVWGDQARVTATFANTVTGPCEAGT